MADGEFDSVEKLGAKVMRPDRRISDEDLIASELAMAIVGDPISKIRHVCEALQLLDDDELAQAEISASEVAEAERLYKLALMFQNVFYDRFIMPDGRVLEDAATLQWPFSQTDAKAYAEWIAPPGAIFHWRDARLDEDDEFSKIDEKTQDPIERAYLYTHALKLTVDCVNNLKTHFAARAMPKAAKLLRKIMQLVSPDSYKAALRAMKSGGSRGAKT